MTTFTARQALRIAQDEKESLVAEHGPGADLQNCALIFHDGKPWGMVPLVGDQWIQTLGVAVAASGSDPVVHVADAYTASYRSSDEEDRSLIAVEDLLDAAHRREDRLRAAVDDYRRMSDGALHTLREVTDGLRGSGDHDTADRTANLYRAIFKATKYLADRLDVSGEAT